jgi:hypothetical protein
MYDSSWDSWDSWYSVFPTIPPGIKKSSSPRIKWCKENVGHRGEDWIIYYGGVDKPMEYRFRKEEDAIMFALLFL